MHGTFIGTLSGTLSGTFSVFEAFLLIKQMSGRRRPRSGRDKSRDRKKRRNARRAPRAGRRRSRSPGRRQPPRIRDRDRSPVPGPPREADVSPGPSRREELIAEVGRREEYRRPGDILDRRRSPEEEKQLLEEKEAEQKTSEAGPFDPMAPHRDKGTFTESAAAAWVRKHGADERAAHEDPASARLPHAGGGRLSYAEAMGGRNARRPVEAGFVGVSHHQPRGELREQRIDGRGNLRDRDSRPPRPVPAGREASFGSNSVPAPSGAEVENRIPRLNSEARARRRGRKAGGRDPRIPSEVPLPGSPEGSPAPYTDADYHRERLQRDRARVEALRVNDSSDPLDPALPYDMSGLLHFDPEDLPPLDDRTNPADVFNRVLSERVRGDSTRMTPAQLKMYWKLGKTIFEHYGPLHSASFVTYERFLNHSIVRNNLRPSFLVDNAPRVAVHSKRLRGGANPTDNLSVPYDDAAGLPRHQRRGDGGADGGVWPPQGLSASRRRAVDRELDDLRRAGRHDHVPPESDHDDLYEEADAMRAAGRHRDRDHLREVADWPGGRRAGVSDRAMDDYADELRAVGRHDVGDEKDAPRPGDANDRAQGRAAAGRQSARQSAMLYETWLKDLDKSKNPHAANRAELIAQRDYFLAIANGHSERLAGLERDRALRAAEAQRRAQEARDRAMANVMNRRQNAWNNPPPPSSANRRPVHGGRPDVGRQRRARDRDHGRPRGYQGRRPRPHRPPPRPALRPAAGPAARPPAVRPGPMPLNMRRQAALQISLSRRNAMRREADRQREAEKHSKPFGASNNRSLMKSRSLHIVAVRPGVYKISSDSVDKGVLAQIQNLLKRLKKRIRVMGVAVSKTKAFSIIAQLLRQKRTVEISVIN